MRTGIEEVAACIRAAGRVAVVSHVSPDGDTIGSALALRGLLLRLGKSCELFCADPVPGNLRMLRGCEAIRRPESLRSDERFDLLLPVDIASADRMGSVGGKPLFDCLRAVCADSAQMDHHGTNPGYCRVNAIDPASPATGLLVRELIAALGVPLDAEMAACLYAAVSTDTGNFSHSNTTAEAFRVTAELMDAGIDLHALNEQLFILQPEAQLRLLARALCSLRLLCGGKVAVMRLSAEDFRACDALPEHAEPIVNKGLSVYGVRLAALVRDSERGVKASLRAAKGYRVDRIAAGFGGGGHTQAAGCTLHTDLDEAVHLVSEALCAEAQKQP